jgi:hypothetical protein
VVRDRSLAIVGTFPLPEEPSRCDLYDVDTICQHFVSGSQTTGVDKGACNRRATQRVRDFAMYDLVDPVMCGQHGLFWQRRGYDVIALERP